MAVVISALLPVFLLIVLGFILKRTLIRPETQWHGLERLTYYVLFPMLLVQTLVKADAARLLAISGERNAVGFVLGLPINMDGSEGPRAQSTRAFARNFSNLTGLAIALWDERLSTAAVERELIGMDVSRARRAEVIDEHAAIFILQGALDRLTKLRGDR